MNTDGIKTTFTLDDVILMTDWTNAYPWTVVLHCSNSQASMLSKLTLNIKNILNLETYGISPPFPAAPQVMSSGISAPMGCSSKRTTTKPLNSSKVCCFVSLCAKYMSFSSNHSNIYKMATLIMAHVLLDDIESLESKIALLTLLN